MSDPRETPAGRGSQNTLFFIVGGLVILVGIIAWVMFGNGEMPGGNDTDITIEAPSTDSGTDTGTDTGTTTGSDTTN